MRADLLTDEEKSTLLGLARAAFEMVVRGLQPAALDLTALSPRLRTDGASFVTLTEDGSLRGCIGALEARQPLAVDVQQHAAGVARYDYRFPPVSEGELNGIRIEISRLSDPIPLLYDSAEDLLRKLRPDVDGVILRDGQLRATYLPQVWTKLPDPAQFMNSLCGKMGAEPTLWRRRPLEVSIYQVEEFHE
ncbi:MAG TPA: AmmeMemoRadiSam system protein A [Anaerolineales bacterium]